MVNYYSLDIIPIILRIFRVNKIIISGMSSKETVNQIISYCDNSQNSYIAIDSQEGFEEEFIKDYTLKVLPKLNNYDAIFINDDPNWFTVYNELNIIKKNNEEFPLVFICNCIFPHKKRDSYIDPKIIPNEFINKYSDELIYNNLYINDGFYHAINENSPKNGVLTAVNDFLEENPNIGLMNIKLSNGIIILYPKNSISQIRIGKLEDEIIFYEAEYDNLQDIIIENQLLTNQIYKNNIFKEEELEQKIIEKNKLISDYENKIQIHNYELNYKNSQIEELDSKLSLKESQINNTQSKLINRENKINYLTTQVEDLNNELKSLKDQFYLNEKDMNEKEQEFNYQLGSINKEFNFLKKELDKKNHIETELKEANYQITESYTLLKNKNNELSYKDFLIKIKQNELNDTEKKLNSIKNKYRLNLSKLDHKEYCISCYKDEIKNNHLEIQYLKKDSTLKKLLTPVGYLYLLFKSKPKDIYLNLKLYKVLKKSECFDAGYYLSHNEDIQESKWCKYFPLELHYVCHGFNEKRRFNKKYFNRNSKKHLLDYILNCKL